MKSHISPVLAVLCCFVVLHKAVEGCIELEFRSKHFPSQFFERLPIDRYPSNTGRPSYISIPENVNEDPFYLYHAVHEETGLGQWIVNHVWNDGEQALTFVNSWAVLPHLIQSVHESSNEHSLWQRGLPQGGWEGDDSVEIVCTGEDRTVYFDSSVALAPQLTGFYVEQHLSEDFAEKHQGPVYSHIARYIQRQGEALYLFVVYADEEQQQYRWLVGQEIGVDAGLAYIADVPGDADLIPSNGGWHFSRSDSNRPWQVDPSATLYSQRLYYEQPQFADVPRYDRMDVFQVVQAIRSSANTDPTSTMELRNHLSIPRIGLGTGGLRHEDSKRIFRQAIDAGYRLFDMAREYGNEYLMGELIQELSQEGHPVQRRDLFLETKVWPTELGFLPTSEAIDRSLFGYQSNYVDLYLLHWPECNPSIDWMHCDTTVDKQATWRESWKALEKAYAEGRVLSIGVSNFNADLLQEAVDHASVMPHVVQNWAEVKQVDAEVRSLCHQYGIVYQPYASVRNLQFMSAETKHYTTQLAKKYDVSEHSVSLRFFLQSGACIIPRSSQVPHLEENMRVLQWALTEEEMQALGWSEALIHGGAARKGEEQAEEHEMFPEL